MATTAVEVVSPAKVLYTGDVEMVICRSVEGEIAFLADHIPFLGALAPCVVRLVAEGGQEVKVAVSGGFVEVRDNHTVILADRAQLGSDVDVDQARSAARQAEERRRAADGDDDEAAAVDQAYAEVLMEAAGAPSGSSA